jgi:small subunit ribosomal protein S9
MPTAAPIQTTGRRKTAIATIKLLPGSGRIKINGRDFEDYFTTTTSSIIAVKPLTLVDQTKKYDIEVKAIGGGINGQAGALSLAIARALCELNIELRPALKAAGLLTRDSRMKERKKPGQPGARRRFQFSKR